MATVKPTGAMMLPMMLPMRQPVIRNAWDRPLIVIVRSRIPSSRERELDTISTEMFVDPVCNRLD